MADPVTEQTQAQKTREKFNNELANSHYGMLERLERQAFKIGDEIAARSYAMRTKAVRSATVTDPDTGKSKAYSIPMKDSSPGKVVNIHELVTDWMLAGNSKDMSTERAILSPNAASASVFTQLDDLIKHYDPHGIHRAHPRVSLSPPGDDGIPHTNRAALISADLKWVEERLQQLRRQGDRERNANDSIPSEKVMRERIIKEGNWPSRSENTNPMLIESREYYIYIDEAMELGGEIEKRRRNKERGDKKAKSQSVVPKTSATTPEEAALELREAVASIPMGGTPREPSPTPSGKGSGIAA